MKNYGFDTVAVHGGECSETTRSRITPIYATTAYTFDSTEHAASLFELSAPGNIYTRIQNPTTDVLEKRVAELEGGVAALAFSSGHAAMWSTFLNLCCAGDEIVSSICIYGGAINMMAVSLRNVGITVKFVDPDDLNAWEDAVTPKTRTFFVEGIGNPNANVADLNAIGKIARSHGIPFIVDNTFATPYLCRVGDFGADIILHSSTKFLGGHGSAMGGIAVDMGTFNFDGNQRFPLYNTPDESYHGKIFARDFGKAGFITRLRVLLMRDLGACPSPFNSFLILQGVETLSLRMIKHCENALKVAEYLEARNDVEFVSYPSLPSNKYYKLKETYLLRGAGSVFSFGIKGGRERCAKFIDNLKLISNVANLGDVRSIAGHPASTTHSQLSAEQLAKSGITEGTVRLSIGIEDASDLIGDIENALGI